jgi:hypothetical protein
MTSNDDKRATSLPDWDLWRHMPSVALWQFCALSLDFDPDSLEVRPGGWMSPGGRLSFEPCSFPSDELAATFDKRYRVLDGQEYRTTGRDYDEVDLAVCAAWALSIGWDIPAELRALAACGEARQPAASAALGAQEQTEPSGKSEPRDWQEVARAIADELDKKDAIAGAHDSVTNIADRVAAELRDRKTRGPRGPLSGATILREALQGRKWKRKR